MLTFLLSTKLRIQRLFYMLKERGLSFTLNFLFMALTYNIDIIKELLFVRFFPHFIFYPRYLELEITTKCNLKCIICEHTYWNQKNVDLTFEQFKRIIDEFPKLTWLGVTGIGSSFLNKDFLKMLRYVKQKNVYIELFDSFNNLNGNLIDVITKESLIDRFIASIDAAEKETYEKLRIGANYDDVINNVKTLVMMKEKYRTHFPEFSFHYIINKNNYSEMPKFMELVYDMTRGKTIGVLFTKLLHSFKEIDNLVLEELPDNVRQETTRVAKQLGIRIMWTKDLRGTLAPIKYCTEWTMPFIFADGSVIPCCAGNEANKREFQVKTKMGNILEKDFKTIWSGEKYRNLRNMIHKGGVPPACCDCPIYSTRKDRIN